MTTTITTVTAITAITRTITTRTSTKLSVFVKVLPFNNLLQDSLQFFLALPFLYTKTKTTTITTTKTTTQL